VVYRRAAVESVGGFARVPLGEDVNSGVKLWTGGWETRYLPLALAKGVAPDSWPAITNQQQRWCRSSMLLMTERHFRDARFNWQQRTAFWAAFLYYMASAGLLITGPFPTLTMLWFFPERVFPHNYLPMVPALLATLLVFPMLARGWRPSIFRLCLVNSACHVIAILDALRAKVQEWVPTGAARKAPAGRKKGAPERVSRLLRTWIVVVQVLLWGGLATRFPEYGIGPLWTTAFLGAVQLFMVFPLLLPSYGIRARKPPPCSATCTVAAPYSPSVSSQVPVSPAPAATFAGPAPVGAGPELVGAGSGLVGADPELVGADSGLVSADPGLVGAGPGQPALRPSRAALYVSTRPMPATAACTYTPRHQLVAAASSTGRRPMTAAHRPYPTEERGRTPRPQRTLRQTP
jgi:hypothetical protein